MMSSIHILESAQQVRGPDTIHQSITCSGRCVEVYDRLLVEVRFG